MTDEHHADRHGPALICAGTDPDRAAAVARQAGSLLAGRSAIVLSAWQPAPGPHGPIDTVLESLYGVEGDVDEPLERRASAAASAACSALRETGWSAEPAVVRDRRRPWQVALDVAAARNASLVVAGRRDGAGHRRAALGREARALAHRTSRPLLVVPPTEPAPPDAPILMAADGSAPATAAIGAASHLLAPRPAIAATAWRSALVAASAALVAMPAAVAEAGAERLDDEARELAERTAGAAATLLRAGGWRASTQTVETRGGVWQALVDAARELGAAAIVTGTRGHSRLGAALLGSVAEAILQHAEVPVLLVPPGRTP